MNYELSVKDLSIETYILTGKINNKKLIENLTEFVKNNKNEELSYKTHVKGHFTGFQSLINNSYFIDFLKEIEPNIKIVFKNNFMISEAWGNLCKINEEVTEHNHGGVNGFCGILYLTEGGPGTYFKEYNILVKEEIGKYILFHPYLNHNVEKIKKDIERITVAFNMSTINEWNDLSNIKWINKDEI